MIEKQFEKQRVNFISVVIVFVLSHLYLEHSTGGVLSHHLLNSSDYPAISNWWELIILPVLAWFSTMRIKKRIRFQPDDGSAARKIQNGILIGFFGMLIVSVLQSITFTFGYENITMYMALGVLFIGLFLPIYRAECILGHVLGATFTFGPVIPLLGILVMATVSAFSHFCIKPLVTNFLRMIRKNRISEA